MSQVSNPLRFGAFELDLGTGELRRDGVKQRLPEQPLQILAMLLERPGEIVTRDELKHRLWSNDTFVDFEHSLNAAVKRLRLALGESADHPRLIETLPRHGYRLLVSIEQPHENLENTSFESHRIRSVQSNPRGWTLAAAAILISLSGMLYVIGGGSHQRSASADRVVLAVLPLQNLNGDRNGDFVADGFTEEVINQLSRLEPQRIGVVGSTSVMVYKSSPKTIRQIGRELGADYILEGSVREEGKRIRITAQLVKVADQTHLWAESYERDSDGTIKVQSEIAHAIAEQVRSRLGLTAKG